MAARMPHFAAVAALLISTIAQAEARCSPAEQVCGDLCCCVTCTCLEGPYRCEDMWGKPTDPVGSVDDERFASREWTENLMREHQERHRRWLEEHEQKRQERREARRARGESDEDGESERLLEGARRRMRRERGGGERGDEDFAELHGLSDMELGPGMRERLAELKERRRARRRSRGAEVMPEDDELNEDLVGRSEL